MKKVILLFIGLITIYFLFQVIKKVNLNTKYQIGQALDEFNSVKVYYNGGVGNVEGRNLAQDGYNLGMKYQCVEFIKKYYYEYLNHKMPDTFGNAIDYFDINLKDGELNLKRNLIQYSNPSHSNPKVNDIIIFDKTFLNRYGHVAIISKVKKNKIEIIQQNLGPFESSREIYYLEFKNNLWYINNKRVLGWLSKK
ncbi:CHAP domain-containing protein [Flavobacterium davisii]|uniref:CHAP domain-containing protein n=1 Tax=Flavobacterium davisii TaxID=2906077 RepID=A0A246GH28_9FLAO|nr:CHAP domain-containing protein [Flavobacterium davisii]OWP83508.1 CHAP domain-containing protein [Flavobacterium davisii]